MKVIIADGIREVLSAALEDSKEGNFIELTGAVGSGKMSMALQFAEDNNMRVVTLGSDMADARSIFATRRIGEGRAEDVDTPYSKALASGDNIMLIIEDWRRWYRILDMFAVIFQSFWLTEGKIIVCVITPIAGQEEVQAKEVTFTLWQRIECEKGNC